MSCAFVFVLSLSPPMSWHRLITLMCSPFMCLNSITLLISPLLFLSFLVKPNCASSVVSSKTLPVFPVLCFFQVLSLTCFFFSILWLSAALLYCYLLVLPTLLWNVLNDYWIQPDKEQAVFLHLSPACKKFWLKQEKKKKHKNNKCKAFETDESFMGKIFVVA